MYILSIHPGGHDGTAVLSKDHKIIAAIQLERLTRVKNDGGRFPDEAVEEVLSVANIKRSDIDVLLLSKVAYPAHYYLHWPFVKFIEYKIRGYTGIYRYKEIASEQNRMNEKDVNKIFDSKWYAKSLGFKNISDVFFYNHHFGHALSALYYTTWDDALIYTADGSGDLINYSARILKNGKLFDIYGTDDDILKPREVNSIALAYGFATQALGFKINRHEGKLTGLAALGKPEIYDDIAKHFFINNEGKILSDFISNTEMKDEIFRLSKKVKPENVASSIQKVLEDKILSSIQLLIKRYKVKHLGLAGGAFANVRLNKLLCEKTKVKEIFIFPGMGDEGISVGGIHQYLLSKIGLKKWLKKRYKLTDVYFGKSYEKEIKALFNNDKSLQFFKGNSAKNSAKLLANGLIGAIYHERMEFGPRALGARSIIASPKKNSINKSLNDRLQRTEFMPFAPYVMEDDASDIFNISEANRYACKFMTITTNVKKKWIKKIPAVVHIDNTARPQIVNKKDNKLYFEILNYFKKITGLPVLVNTSFNAHEEPIINKPNEALASLKDMRIDFLVTKFGLITLKNNKSKFEKILNEKITLNTGHNNGTLD